MDDLLLNFSPRFYATDSLFWGKLTYICTRSSVSALIHPRGRFRISFESRSSPRKEFVRRDLGANDHQFHRIHWMMPGLEVQKDQHSAQKTLLSNLGKDAKNNLGWSCPPRSRTYTSHYSAAQTFVLHLCCLLHCTHVIRNTSYVMSEFCELRFIATGGCVKSLTVT